MDQNPNNIESESIFKKGVIKRVIGFLEQENYRFHSLENDNLELFLQGKNLVMHVMIYVHNRHLIVKIPTYIKDSGLRKAEILLALLKMMNDYYDIRMELSEESDGLSASCNHILEDGFLTKSQFFQCLTATAFIVDETYPKIMKILFGNSDRKVFLNKVKTKNNEEAEIKKDEKDGIQKVIEAGKGYLLN
ncbi:MAG: hypothetical protein HQM08_07320 [Candidatus Riflebacteria bacterium]|nr:hypothetical protein [Candidatus Riflebacteria bacterium]